MAEARGGAYAVNGGLVMLVQHKTWATLRLIEHCRSLDDEQLNATVPGTFGSIRATLQHLVGAEEGYFATLTGERLSERMSEEPVPLDELAERLRRLGPRWEALARDPDVASREVTTRDGWRTLGAVLLAQAIHHADDHRSHVLSTIGARGLDLPGLDIGEDLDVWHYAIATGAMQEIAPGAAG
ncbi:MAG TPA: DinB family protein [Thermomicrobiales bacterium]|nr:DinB family protein [Thermomicrobiales bacterium]